jgi:hypothetical protein
VLCFFFFLSMLLKFRHYGPREISLLPVQVVLSVQGKLKVKCAVQLFGWEHEGHDANNLKKETIVDTWSPQVNGSKQTILREKHKCWECTEFRPLKLLKFIYMVYTGGLSIQSLKPHGGGYSIVTKITVVHISTGHQKLDLISCSLSQILQMFESFSS